MAFRALAGALLVLPLATAAQSVAPAPAEQVSALVQGWLSGPADARIAGEAIDGAAQLAQFYGEHQYRPIWSDGAVLLPKATELLQALRSADREGLEPSDYHVDVIGSRMSGRALAPQQLAELELLLSDAFLRYVVQVNTGRLDPKVADPEWFIFPPKLDGSAWLERLTSTRHITEMLQDLPPAQPEYVRLRTALAHYRMLAAKGGWPTVAEGPKLHKGERDKRVAMVRKRLRITGDLEQGSGDNSQVFDAALEQAVKRFQERHGLLSDGVIGAKTVEEMNVPAQVRVRQIAANMERWRWMPRDLGNRYVLINMAGFELDVMDKGQSALGMRVIVGKPFQRTPAFSSAMTYLIFHPYWNIPPKIAIHEIMPKAQKDPGFLEAQNIKVIYKRRSAAQDPDVSEGGKPAGGYRLRQAPGPRNPLGKVKFLLPNPFDVYLHDTPSRELFKRTVRTFSHGCIRLEKPAVLAQYLLQSDPRWNQESIQAALDRNVTRSVRLPEPVPVYIVYWTAWVDADGVVQFRDDIYDRDQHMQEVLEKLRGKGGEAPVYKRMALR